MGMIVDGVWRAEHNRPAAQGRFQRATTAFRGRISADGSTEFPAEAGRYHLYVSYACPWAHRTLIVRNLRGLAPMIGLSVARAFMGEMGWGFSPRPGHPEADPNGGGLDTTPDPGSTPDSVLGKRYVHQVYIAAQPDYTGRASVPVLYDTRSGRIVNNESREIIRMLDTAFVEAGLGDPAADFAPAHLRPEIDRVLDAIYEPINNGVYRCGFSRTQEAYEEALGQVFDALEHWERVLEQQRYLCGDTVTEADWCLFTTLVRFDPVYHYHFKCNRRRLRDFPNLWNHTLDLYQTPGVAETVNLDHIKRHYFSSHETINPTRIVPVGPEIDYSTPHDRGRFAATR